jgi:hypothetical protein
MIAEQLDQNQQFEDAEKWYRYIFNPTDTSAYPSPDKFWITKTFLPQCGQQVRYSKNRKHLLGVDAADQTLVNDVTDWRNNSFQPHYIAEYRTVAYQKTAVMKYLDHLLHGEIIYSRKTRWKL